MTEHNRLLARGWLLALLAAGFVTIHLVLFHILRHANGAHALLPGAFVSVLLLLAVAKHVGLLAVLFRRLHSLFRRGPRP